MNVFTRTLCRNTTPHQYKYPNGRGESSAPRPLNLLSPKGDNRLLFQLFGLDGDDPAARHLQGDGLQEEVLPQHLPLTILGGDPLADLGEVFLELLIVVGLKGEATHQPAAEPGDLRRVQGKLLFFGHLDGDQLKVLQEVS